jgi:phosphatidylglycerol:prolipoprotein diacylglycerol transferase
MSGSALPFVHLGFEALGYAAAVVLFLIRRERRDVVDAPTRYALTLAAGIGATAGARLLAALCDPVRTWTALADGRIAFGKTIVGALLGGWIAVEWLKKKRGIAISTGDPLVLPLAAGIAIGRIGCFFAASIDDTAGLPSSLPWAVGGMDGVARHPVALYEIAVVVLLASVAGRLRAPGDPFKAFLGGYLGFRFFCDFLKPVPPRIFGGLSAIQLACLGGLMYYALVLARRLRSAEATG